MKKSFFFEGDIDHENVSKFIQDVDESLSVYDVTSLVIYFTSSGGDTYCGDILVHYLGGIPPHIDVVLVAAHEISSTAFHVFFETQCNKLVLKDTIAAIHLTTNIVDIRELKESNSQSKFTKEEIDRINERDLEEYADMGFTKKELKLISSGQTLYLNTDRLIKLL